MGKLLRQAFCQSEEPKNHPIEVANPDYDTKALNAIVTDDEILKCIKKLKQVKSPGIDLVSNEMIITSYSTDEGCI